jgi:hypothetical protein
MSGEQLTTFNLQLDITWEWCQHPRDPSEFIEAGKYRLEVFAWEDLHAGHTTPVSVLDEHSIRLSRSNGQPIPRLPPNRNQIARPKCYPFSD